MINVLHSTFTLNNDFFLLLYKPLHIKRKISVSLTRLTTYRYFYYGAMSYSARKYKY